MLTFCSAKQLWHTQRTCWQTAAQHEKNLLVNRYAIFLKGDLELSGVDDGRVGDSS